MTWPQATDYNAAVQNPQLCFGDDDLRQGQAVGDVLGLPRPHSGNFADVYQIQGSDNQSWAVKCFTRPVTGLRPRYQAITEHLQQTQRAFMVEFRFLDEGICIRGERYPLVKMRWVEGFRLNEFVRDQLDKPIVLDRLAQMWIRLGQELRDAGMAHGDLQHGNVLLVPGSKSTSLALKLIDYDGMYVPSLADRPSGEVGHPNYQHPQRLREGGYDPQIDRFSHLLIYTALRCLRVGGEELWQRHDSGENLLFREEDFRQPARSRLLRELWSIKDRDARDLVGHLVLASQGPLLVVPSLDELLDGSVVRPLTGSEERQVSALLEETARAPRPLSQVKRAPATAEMPVQEIPQPPSSVLVVEPATETATHPAALDPTTPALPRLPPPLPRSGRHSSGDIELGGVLVDAPKGAWDLTRLSDPLVSILSRPGWLAVLGGVALLSFVVVNVLVWASLKPKPPGPTVAQPRLQSIDDVTVKGGHRYEVLLTVERNECEEPLTIQVHGLPPDMPAPPLTLKPEQESIPLPLLAPLDVELPPREIIVSLWRGDEKIEEQHFQFSVSKTPRPFLRKPDNIVCPAGASFDLTGRVDRNGCEEPLVVEFAGLKGVRQEQLPPANADSPRVRLIVPADTPPAELVPLNLVLRAADAVADTKALFLSIKEAPPRIGKEMASRFKIEKAPDALSVKAGDKKELPISLARGDYKGPIEVRLENLPAGVKAAPVTVPAESSSAVVVVEAATDADTGDYAVKVRAVPGEHQLDEREFELRVEKADPPEAVVNGGPRWKRVVFSTVDHAELVGSLYAGSKGKNGACVLMLHDLGRGHDRKERGWTRLAEALQAEGHTVLTFDFRGHGESIRVPRTFWDSTVNRNFSSFRRTRPQDGLPARIQFDDFPNDYLPWLIHDIAAARNFLDLRHDDADGPVNTFNMVVIGAGQGAALGTLWLASEGVRFNAVGVGEMIKTKPPEKLSVLRAVWIGMSGKLRGGFDVRDWIRRAHGEPVVPTTFVYGEDDRRTTQYFRSLIKDGVIEESVTPKTAVSGERLLDPDSEAAEAIRSYLVNTLGAIRPQPWARRKSRQLWSFWGFPPPPKMPTEFFLAKKRGEVMPTFVPLERFDITIAGMQPQKPLVPGR